MNSSQFTKFANVWKSMKHCASLRCVRWCTLSLPDNVDANRSGMWGQFLKLLIRATRLMSQLMLCIRKCSDVAIISSCFPMKQASLSRIDLNSFDGFGFEMNKWKSFHKEKNPSRDWLDYIRTWGLARELADKSSSRFVLISELTKHCCIVNAINFLSLTVLFAYCSINCVDVGNEKAFKAMHKFSTLSLHPSTLT